MQEHSVTTTSTFRTLFNLDVSKYVEKKGQFNYVSWPFAVAQLRLADPTASWEVRRFEGLPYQATEAGVFVEVAVTVQGVTLSQIHPVLDSKNRPILAPNGFDINTSIQRCLVKAIALHGLGLSIYAGEDLPDLQASGGHEEPTETPTVAKTDAVKPKVTASISPLPSNDRISVAQVKLIDRLIVESHVDKANFLTYFGVAAVEEIAKTEAQRVIRSLENAKRRAA